MNIAEIIAKDNYMLYIRAEDGKTGFFDVKPYLESEVFAPLKDRLEFERIHNGKYFIEWDCGADLSADTIQARWKTASTGDAQSGSRGFLTPSPHTTTACGSAPGGSREGSP